MQYLYPVDIRIDEDGRHVVLFPDLPECMTDGASRDEALTEAIDALEESLAYRINYKKEIPPPSPHRGRPVVAPGAAIAAKAALYQAFGAAGISQAELARRLGVDRSEIRRLLSPRHGSSIERLNDAVAQLDRRIVVGWRGAA